MRRTWRPAFVAVLVALAGSLNVQAQDEPTDAKKSAVEPEPGPKPRLVGSADVGPPPRVVGGTELPVPGLEPYFECPPVPYGNPYAGYGSPFGGGGVAFYDAIPYLNPWWLDPYRGTFTVPYDCYGKCSFPVIPPPIFIPNSQLQVTPVWPPTPVAYPVGLFARSNRPAARENHLVPATASADRLYADALGLFWDGNYKAARDHLAAAVRKDPRDARMWYYKSLAERALGETAAARQSAENGAALEITGVTERRTVLAALERVQGRERMDLEDLVKGPKALSVQTAEDIVARLKPVDPDGTALTTAR